MSSSDQPIQSLFEGMGSTTLSRKTPSRSKDEFLIPVPHKTSEARMLMKLDFRILPCLMALFLLAFLDKVNIANAAVLGLVSELRLTGSQFNTCLVMFFVAYVIFDIPATVVMKRIRPHVWLSASMFMFGLVSMTQGFVQSYRGLLAARFFLGLSEAGIFACCFYIISMWYKRSEAQRRFTFFYCSATLAGAFGGLLASAIGLMDGLRGYKGWRWVFIVEGSFTCVVSILFFFVLPDFPEKAKWLSADQLTYVQARLITDQGDNGVDQRITIKSALSVFKDVKVIIAGVMYFALIVPAYGYALFAPTIISQYGYSPIMTQLYSVPPWVCAWGFANIIAFLSDRLKHRFAFVLIPCFVAIIGLVMLLTIHDNVHVQYAALFLVVMGIYTASPVAICWSSMNVGGHTRRSIAIGFQIGFGNAGGIPSSYLFLHKDSPRYTKGYATCLALVVVSITMACLYFTVCLVQNGNRDRLKQKRITPTVQGGEESTTTKAETIKEEGEGDLSPNFRFLL